VGRPRRTGRLRTWLSTTRHRRPGRQLQPERAADGGRSSTHEQPPLGGGAGECPADRAGHWPAARLGRQRLAAVALDRSILIERVGRLSSSKLELVLAGIDTVLGR